jgi:hypothetical protein
MLRERVAVGVCAAASLAGGLALLQGGSAPGAPLGDSCADPESTYTTDSLHDLRSFSDAMAIVRGVKQTIPPPPSGPEGWAGLIGRQVTVRVERVLWRRPHAPAPPRRFRFSDLGWAGTLEHKRPLAGCGETRMVLGRRYLAPIVRHGGTWYPLFPTRLRLRGDLVVGGVDAGEPENSHQALQGRSVAGAVRLVAQTKPYRAVVLHPHGSPADRWQAVYRDHYRIWHAMPGMPVVVESGVTSRSRWQLYLRLPARGGMCVGMNARPLRGDGWGPSGEGCGPRTLPAHANRLALFAGHRRGGFAFGHTGSAVVWVRVRFDGEDWQEMQTEPTPIPPGGRGRFWVAPANGDCLAVTVQALDVDKKVLNERRIDAGPMPAPGSPDPYAACRSG